MIRIRIDKDELTLDDHIMLDDLRAGAYDARQMRDFLSRFMILDDGTKPTAEDGVKAAGKLTKKQVEEVFAEFGRAMAEIREQAVPPTKSGS